MERAQRERGEGGRTHRRTGGAHSGKVHRLTGLAAGASLPISRPSLYSVRRAVAPLMYQVHARWCHWFRSSVQKQATAPQLDQHGRQPARVRSGEDACRGPTR